MVLDTRIYSICLIFFIRFPWNIWIKLITVAGSIPLLVRPSWSYGSWIYNYLCNQCLSPLTLWVKAPLLSWYNINYVIKFVSDLWQVSGFLYTTLCDKVCQWLMTGQWFSQGTTVSTTNKTDLHDITEVLLKVG